MAKDFEEMLDEEYEDDIITLTTADGEEVDFVEIAGIAHDGKFYAILQPVELLDGMDDDEVPASERYLFITPTLLGLVRDLDTTKSKEVLAQFAGVFKVPQSRFYTAIDQLDGTTSGEETGGYVKASGAKNINFMIVHKPAVIQFEKHVVPKIVTPEQNQNADAWKFGYRNVSIADGYENKVKGIYLHKATS